MFPWRYALKQQLCEATAKPIPVSEPACATSRIFCIWYSTPFATRLMGAEVAAEVPCWIQDLALSMLAAEVAAEQKCAQQHRGEFGALQKVAAEVEAAVEQRCALQHRRGCSELQEGAVEVEAQAGEAEKFVIKTALAGGQMERLVIHG